MTTTGPEIVMGETFYASWMGLSGMWMVTEVCGNYVGALELPEVTLDIRIQLVDVEGQGRTQGALPAPRPRLSGGKL